MSGPAISVQGLGKRYQIGGERAPYRTLRETLVEAARAPFRRFRQLQGSDAQARHIWALKDVSFDVQPGEVVGIIGRNGAGKSTLLKILSRITEPTEGRVVTRGRIGSLLEVGTGFHPELTGRENIFLNGAILGMTRKEIARKFDEIVAFAEIDDFLDTPVKRYSSGMYVRLAFAVAAHLEPEILVVDEVLAVGDAAFQKKCLGKMGEVAGEGRTVLFVSHNMAAVNQLCARAIWLSDGQVEAEGECSGVVDAYMRNVIEAASRTDSLETSALQGESVAVRSFSIRMDRSADVPFGSLVIHLDCQFEAPIEPFGIGVQITASNGVVVGRYAPAVTGQVFSVQPGQRSFTVRFPEIERYLADGDYAVDLWLARQRVRVILDLPNAGVFSVADPSAYGAGRSFDSRQHGFVKLPVEVRSERPGQREADLRNGRTA